MSMPPEFETMVREKARAGWTPREVYAEVDRVFAEMGREAAAATYGGAAGRAEAFAATGDPAVLMAGVPDAPEPKGGEYRVELSRRFGQWDRVSFVDAMDEDDARSCFKGLPPTVRIVSVRATGRRY